MTSSTSARPQGNPLALATRYFAATLFCALFGAVYELFGHGVYSYCMIYAFAIPCVLGVLPNLVRALRGRRVPGGAASGAWGAGVAALTVGCLFQGVLEIYGTTSHLVIVYPVAAALLFAAAGVLRLGARRSPRASRASSASRAHVPFRVSSGKRRTMVQDATAVEAQLCTRNAYEAAHSRRRPGSKERYGQEAFRRGLPGGLVP